MRIFKLSGILIILLLLIQPSVSAKRWALLVGINDYEHPSIRDLRGCERDVKLISEVLREKYGFTDDEMKTLFSREATRDAIVTAFKEWLIEKPQEGDVVLFYFSGHGSQVIDEDGDEADGWDELLCPADLKPRDDRKQYLNPILDDELGDLLNQIPTKNVTVVLDSCHSGTGTKSLTASPKMIPRDLVLVRQKPPKVRPQKDREAQVLENHVLISGSAAEQVSLDAPWSTSTGETYYSGVLTHNLVERLRQATAETSYIELMKSVKVGVSERSHQRPQLEGNADRPIFSTYTPDGSYTPSSVGALPDKPFVPVISADGNRVTLGAGSIRGVTPGSVYDIFSSGNTGFTGDPLAKVRITSVDPETSAGNLLDARTTIQRGQRAVESSHAYPPDKLYLDIRFEGNAPQFESLRKAFSEIPDLAVVESGKYADLVLEVEPDGFNLSGRLTAADGSEIGKTDAASAAELAGKLKPNLNNAFAKKRLINLKNPNPPFKIEVSMDRAENPIYQIGDEATFTFRSEKNCYLTLLDVDTQGHITMLFPNTYHPNNQIVANVTYTIPSDTMKFRIRAQGPPGKELLKAIATTERITLPEFDLNKLSGTKSIFLDVGGADEVRHLTRSLGRAFVVEEKQDSEPEPGAGAPSSVTHLPTSKFVTSEFIAEIVP